MRNPLDVLISRAFAFEPNLAYIATKINCNLSGPNPLRSIIGLRRLANLEWFENLAAKARDHYHSTLATKSTYTIKYEEIMSNPITSIQKIATCLNVDCATDKAESIWQNVGCQPLSKRNKSHFFAPGAGKWKKYLLQSHMDILIKLGYEDLLKKLGYNCALCGPETTNEYDIVRLTYSSEQDRLMAYTSGIHNAQGFGANVKSIVHKKMTALNNIYADKSLFTDSIEMINQAQSAFKADYFTSVIMSLEV